MSTHTEEHIHIKRTQNGEADAFDVLVIKYHPRVYHQILGKMKNPETAKDLTQETWLKAFRAINTFRGNSAFYSWLYRIAKNVCINYHRKQKASDNIHPLHTINERRLLGAHPDPCELLQQQELRQHLDQAIATLTPSRKRVFLLYYIEELSIKDIATRTGRSEGTIKSHLRNARLQLQKHLTPYLKSQDMF